MEGRCLPRRELGEFVTRMGAVYGADLAARMLDVKPIGGHLDRRLISPPDLNRSNRTAMLIFVNGRPIRSAALSFAIEDAYSGQLMVGRHPIAALCIRLDPADLRPKRPPDQARGDVFGTTGKCLPRSGRP